MIEDFEKYWLAKFARSLEGIAGKEIRDNIMAGSEEFSDSTNREDVITWSKAAIKKLDDVLGEKERIIVMTGCACEYPKSDLQEIKKTYTKTKDVDRAHRMLQERFVSFLKESLKLKNELIEDIVSRGWGVAGIKKGNTIIATKIPKSGNLVDYMNEANPEKKRSLYCHCPRVRSVLKMSGTKLSPTYCYCGAGFYRGIWEEIIQRPVQVEVLETVMKGDDVCKIAIYLPS